jgi:cytochrome c oxidase cbb3-type subunit 3
MHGGIGPNLLDTVWIHGGSPEEIRHTIDAGVPAKGMLTWGPILGPEKVAAVASYVVSRNREANHTAPGS